MGLKFQNLSLNPIQNNVLEQAKVYRRSEAKSCLFRPTKSSFFCLKYRQSKIESSTEITLLGVKIDEQLKFKSHIEELRRKAGYKLFALHRIRKYLTVKKSKFLANAFINSQFTYAPLIWMFAGKSSITKICKMDFRTLQIVYNNYDKSYQDLFYFSSDISIHQKHLQLLAIEVYKSLMNINAGFMWKFSNKNPLQYNARSSC